MDTITHLQQTGIEYPESIVEKIQGGILTQEEVNSLLIQCRDHQIEQLQGEVARLKRYDDEVKADLEEEIKRLRAEVERLKAEADPDALTIAWFDGAATAKRQLATAKLKIKELKDKHEQV